MYIWRSDANSIAARDGCQLKLRQLHSMSDNAFPDVLDFQEKPSSPTPKLTVSMESFRRVEVMTDEQPYQPD